MFQKNDVSQIKKILVKQLYKDYENILYTYDVKLKTPIIKITEAQSYYGSWCHKTRTLGLSYSLFTHDSWVDILEILKHEMAHQYVDDIFEETDNHGPLFQKACELLRVAAWARTACVKVDSSLARLALSNRVINESQSLRLVRKLLKLGLSSNKHEAYLALQKASDIARKHQIDSFEINPDNKVTELVIKTSKMKVQSYEAHIVQIIVEYFSVKVIYSSLFSLERLREEKTLEFFGAEQNVKMAEYVYLFLKRKVLHLWEEHRKLSSQKGLKNKNQFLYGVLMGLEKHLKDSQRNKSVIFSKLSSSLPAVLDKKIQFYISRKHPKIRETTSRQSIPLTDAYRNGFVEGNKIRIHKPLGKEQKKFLP